MFKKIKAGMVALLLSVGVFSSVAQAEDVIRLGINLELTGDYSEQGYSAYEGVRLAVDETNRQGGVNGKKVILITGSNRSNATEAGRVTDKMIKEGVVAVIGPIKYSNIAIASKMLEDKQIPLISPAAKDPRSTVDRQGNAKPYVFKLTSPDLMQAQIMAKFARKQIPARTAAIYVDASDSDMIDLAETFEKEFTSQGGQVSMIKTFEPQNMAYPVTLQNLRFSKPDVIFIAGRSQEAAKAIRYFREQGIKAAIVGLSNWESNDFQVVAGAESLNQVYFCNVFSPSGKDPQVSQFVEAYKKRYGGESPSSYAALGYDSAKIVLDQLVNSGEANSEGLQMSLHTLKDYKGVTGEITMSKTHEALRSMVIVEYQDGEPIIRDKVNP